MKPYIDIVYRRMSSSEDLTNVILGKLSKIQKLLDSSPTSHVIVDIPHKHKKNGRNFRVSVDMKYQGRTVNCSNQSENPFDAVAQVFESLTREVKRHSRKKRSRRYQSKYIIESSPESIDDIVATEDDIMPYVYH